MQTGDFFIKAGNTGRCMNVRDGGTAAGTVTEIYDCSTTWTTQKFAIQANAS